MSNPLVITLGDPAGIGPEVLAKTLAARASPDAPESAQAVGSQAPWLIIGSKEALLLGAEAAGVELPEFPLFPESAISPTLGAGQVGLMNLGPLPQGFQVGSVQAGCGAQAVQAVVAFGELKWIHLPMLGVVGDGVGMAA